MRNKNTILSFFTNFTEISLLTICFCIFSSSAFAQTKENIPFDTFGNLGCEFLLMRSDSLFETLKENPDSKAHIIFYEGKHSRIVRGGKYKSFNPKHGQGRNETEAISLYLTKCRKLPKERITIIDGGYDTNYRVEIWIVKKNDVLPKPNPSLMEKDVKFSKGNPYQVIDCQKIYSDM